MHFQETDTSGAMAHPKVISVSQRKEKEKSLITELALQYLGINIPYSVKDLS
jgi:hypothetical protein